MKVRHTFSTASRALAVCLYFLPGFCFAALTLIQKSEPAGLFPQSTLYFDFNDTFTTQNIAEKTGGYAFTHWEINGNRTEIPKTSVSLQVSASITQNTMAIAHYVDTNQDSDNDGINDWYEIRNQGGLSFPTNSDDDNDSIPYSLEYKFGLNPNLPEQINEGGISIRRSKKVFVNLGGARKLQVRSDPPGLLASLSSFPEVNSTYNSQNLNGIQSGYYFSHWEVNGIRKAGPSGKSLSKISELMDQDKEIVARFVEQNLDADEDEIPDWYELHEFGTLDLTNQSNPDEDAFSLEEERKYGLSGNIKDSIREGGISVRRSTLTKVNLGGGSFVKITSDPPGMLNSDFILQEKNSTYQSVSLNGQIGNYVFSYWEINGVRQTSSSGIGLSRVTEKLDSDKTIVAKYFDKSADTDSDGIPDWYENQQFGNLTSSGESDPDGDGLKNDEEIKFGLSPLIKDQFFEGGIALRRAKMLSYVKDLSDSSSSFDSDGDGLSDKKEKELGSNASLTDTDGDGYSDYLEFLAGSNLLDAMSFPNQAPNGIYLTNDEILEGEKNGTIIGVFSVSDPNPNSFHTIHLLDQNHSITPKPFFIDENNSLRTSSILDFEKNQKIQIKVRATDEGNLSFEKSFTIKIKNLNEDMDQDGIEDAFDDDMDGDGFSNEEEKEYGSDPMNPDSIANSPPTNIKLSQLKIAENMPKGSFVANISAIDPDINASIQFSLIETNNSKDSMNQFFKITPKNKLITQRELDYETTKAFTITIMAFDEFNASSVSNFPIEVLNIIEDLDQDGVEDYFDKDIDGDGFSNEEEMSFGSDPSNPESLVNSSPSDLFLSASTFLENLPAGTHVGNFLGLDPDKNSTLRYELVDGNGSLNNKHFLVKQDGTLLTNRIFDYENKPKLSVRVRVTDGFDAHLDKIFFLQVEDVFEEPIDRLPIVYTEDALKGKDNQFQLNGSIVERGDFETEETGFIFHIDGKEPESISAKMDPQNLAFKLNVEVIAGENHYFQAYVKTAFGTAYGAIKKFIITDTNKSKAWWNELSPNKVDGWLTDSWIGELMPFENQWAFHLRLQWIYLQSDGNEGFWIWKEENGWIWTNSESWPFLWSNETGNWLYFIPLDSGYIFYDYSESRLQ